MAAASTVVDVVRQAWRGNPNLNHTLRDRLCDAAANVLTTEGWGKVTMARLAEDAGVSRQTVYNEIGTKNDLAEALVLRELDRFLSQVREAFDEHPDVLVDAIREATERVLVYALDNELLRAVVSATHGADTELVPLLTTHAGFLLEGAKDAVATRIADYEVDVPAERLPAAIDFVVRLVFSHVMQPTGEPAETADNLAWIVGQVLTR